MTLPQVGLPPYARRLDVRATRAAFAAGTLGTVGDHTAREDVHRDVKVRDSYWYDLDVVPLTDHEPREWYVPRYGFVIDCKCGWCSPLCAKHDKAQRLYDAHRKRKSGAPRERAV